jgi:hypothetical protein
MRERAENRVLRFDDKLKKFRLRQFIDENYMSKIWGLLNARIYEKIARCYLNETVDFLQLICESRNSKNTYAIEDFMNAELEKFQDKFNRLAEMFYNKDIIFVTMEEFPIV